MKHYTARSFDLPKLEGISEKQIAEHLKLYAGYVKHTNAILEKATASLGEKRAAKDYELHELWRRFGFEFGGMRNHEYYFAALEGGAQTFNPDSAVGKALTSHFGSYDDLTEVLHRVGATRGSGWAMLYHDPVADQFLVGWVDEHHLGQLSTLEPILALDCWEHAYMVDYLPGERGKYIDAYLSNVNWETVDKWFQEIAKK